MDAEGVRKFLAIKVAEFDSQIRAAAAMGVSDSHLAHVLSGKDKPGPRVLKYLGLRRIYHYEFDGLPR